jgi:hypothetical protein
MQAFSSGRRRTLAAFAALALAGVAPAVAQDPNVSLAKAAALEWLVLADKNDIAGTYANASERFRGQMSAEQWGAAFANVREQFGPVIERTFVGSRAVDAPKEAPQSMFLVLGFRTEFAKRQVGMETISLEREADGTWRVVGYLMQ